MGLNRKLYPHERLLKYEKINDTNLPEDIRMALAEWNKDYYSTSGYHLSLERASQGIAEEIQDWLDEMEEEPQLLIQKMSKNEHTLHKLYQEGIRKLSKEQLKQAGFNTGFWSPLTSQGCKVGQYQLTKKLNDKVYELSKSA